MINKINNEIIKIPNTGIVKYHVKLKFEVDGLVEKADIIGAIFGQTEGLLGPEMNLNELQKVSKVGRIEVNVDSKSNSAKGDALIPMSTDISTAALIAAAIESIDKVGPFQAKFSLIGIDDIRAIKKKIIVDRAKKIVQEWATKTISEGEEMLKDVYDASKPGRLTTFGKAQLACGVGVYDSDWIILVEGRADVINLLRAGYDNAIAIEGAKIDETILKLTQGKRIIAFIDGDRAGDLILKELQGLVKIDKVYRAPLGREVEECTPLEISEILKDVNDFIKNIHIVKQDFDNNNQIGTKEGKDTVNDTEEKNNDELSAIKKRLTIKEQDEIVSIIKQVFPDINETLEAIIFDKSLKTMIKVPVSEIVRKVFDTKGGKLLVLDGIITQRLVEAANKAGIQYIIGHRTTSLKKPVNNIQIQTFSDIGIMKQPNR
ncbi:MAG: DNA primase DnaG [Candidatus Nitrosocosmicus sp.]